MSARPWPGLKGHLQASAVFGRPLTVEDRTHIDREGRALAAAAADIARRVGHILFIGRDDRLKGADTVLRAFAALTARTETAHLTFVGPDRDLELDDGRRVDMAGALAELAPRAAERITFLGPQDADMIAALHRTHPIALIASRYENLNYSLLEALSAGQAIVATCGGGLGEVLTHESTALLTPLGDPVAMSAALERLLTDDGLRRSLAAAARALVQADFSPEGAAACTAAFCRAVLARPQQR